ncbi:MAG: 4Fe-4S cluster-binding domain-containing protein [Bacteroides sp.]|nr:4Fe-4S cluster-binding domain-containing protein [Ruminococcus flavefaciens]MCM1554578.1 4Fe-4S cluster-binding domain-containing protein [Bacteroides sp.]
MLRLASYDVVFSEVPDEVTLALNLANCPHRCQGCHSPHLREDRGEPLDRTLLAWLLENYGNSVTCVCFMGGDAEPEEVARCVAFVKNHAAKPLKTAWYSGSDTWPESAVEGVFDYVKIGSYREDRGGLDNPATNQRMYRLKNGQREDITGRFWKKGLKI